MSTPALIKIDGINFAKIYKHWDGDPDSTLPWLKRFNEEFAKKRGDDPEYKFAQLLRDSAFNGERFDLDDSRFTGWGVVGYNDFSADYEYTLHKDGSVSYS